MIVDLEYIPKGWKKVKIPKVLFFQEGPGVRKWQFTDDGVKLLNVGNINKGKINLNKTSIHLSEEEANGKYAHFLVDDGDLLIACSGIVVDNFYNKIAFAKKKHLPLCLNTSTMRFKALSDKIDLNYFKYFLQTNHFTAQLQKLITGSAQLNFGPSHIKKIDLLLPPVETQKHIAQILDDAVALRDKTEQILKEFDLLTQSIFLDMFGDPAINKNNFPLRTLKEFYSSEKEGTKCGPFGSALKKEEYVKEGIPVWNMDNISKNGEFINDIRLWIMEDKYLKLSSYSVIDDDIIISRAGTVGKMCVVKSEFKKSIISTNLIRLRLDKKQLLPLFFSLMMNYFKEKIGRLKTGSEGAFTHMNTGILNNLKFPYPSIELQNQFAEKIALIEQQKELAKQELKESEDLFNCLLQKAFKGELV